jgi:myo-inositol 2-dehydrogenase / D-chiro-inositol 1-dehydrogenase
VTRLTFGVIGAGNRGRALARAALATGAVEIAAFADPHPPSRQAFERVAPAARGYVHYEQLLGHAGLNAVIVATPNDQHTAPVLAAHAAGVPVLCEKPLAPTLLEIDRLAAAAAGTDRICQVGMELRYAPLFREFHALVADGRIGLPKMLWCHEFRPPFKPGVGEWRLAQASSGGTLLEKNCHHFDLFNWLSGGRPTRVMAMGSRDTIYADRDILDRAWVMVEYENGVQASLGIALFFEREQLELGALGAAGKLTATVPDGQLVLDVPGGRSLMSFAQPADFAHAGELEQQLAFIHSIRTGQPPLVNIEAARWSHAIALAAEAAILTGLPVTIDASG